MIQIAVQLGEESGITLTGSPRGRGGTLMINLFSMVGGPPFGTLQGSRSVWTQMFSKSSQSFSLKPAFLKIYLISGTFQAEFVL